MVCAKRPLLHNIGRTCKFHMQAVEAGLPNRVPTLCAKRILRQQPVCGFFSHSSIITCPLSFSDKLGPIKFHTQTNSAVMLITSVLCNDNIFFKQKGHKVPDVWLSATYHKSIAQLHSARPSDSSLHTQTTATRPNTKYLAHCVLLSISIFLKCNI